MRTHELDLWDNAVDSLEESLLKFEEGDAGEQRSYKFSVLHMAHFVELAFKYYISEIHALLIYKNPFAQKLDENKTIGLWEAINFINNEDPGAISKELRGDLEWLKRLRNDIEHHKFSMDVPEARMTIGRLFRSVIEFLDDYAGIDIATHIPNNAMDVFKILSDEYEQKRHDAVREAEKIEEETYVDPSDPDSIPVRLDCDECGNPTLVVCEESGTGYRCTLCGNEESDERPANCDICGVLTTYGELVFWENQMDQMEGRCYYCSGRHHMDKND